VVVEDSVSDAIWAHNGNEHHDLLIALRSAFVDERDDWFDH
jgi:hypothetical protein